MRAIGGRKGRCNMEKGGLVEMKENVGRALKVVFGRKGQDLREIKEGKKEDE